MISMMLLLAIFAVIISPVNTCLLAAAMSWTSAHSVLDNKIPLLLIGRYSAQVHFYFSI